MAGEARFFVFGNRKAERSFPHTGGRAIGFGPNLTRDLSTHEGGKLKHAVYSGTANLYDDTEMAAKSLVANSDVDKIYFLIGEERYPRELPDMIECIDVSGQFDYQSEWHCSKTPTAWAATGSWFDYQSEWHCSKTSRWPSTTTRRFDYQSEWHCSKTSHPHTNRSIRFDYQSEWHCSKTPRGSGRGRASFDYQSEWHCSKTHAGFVLPVAGLITSRNGTAPKHAGRRVRHRSA